jgi:hypothetical protein
MMRKLGQGLMRLTSNWIIPPYARDCLWLVGDSDAVVQVQGEQGDFEFARPQSTVTVHWSGKDGPALAALSWQPDGLGWDGSVGTGGYLDAMHVTQMSGFVSPLTVFYMGGQPLKIHVRPQHLHQAMRTHVPYPSADFHSGVAADIRDSVTTWIVVDDSRLASVAQNAMIQNLRLHFWGRLADNGLDAHFALPLLLQAVTVFPP